MAPFTSHNPCRDVILPDLEEIAEKLSLLGDRSKDAWLRILESVYKYQDENMQSKINKVTEVD